MSGEKADRSRFFFFPPVERLALVPWTLVALNPLTFSRQDFLPFLFSKIFVISRQSREFAKVLWIVVLWIFLRGFTFSE